MGSRELYYAYKETRVSLEPASPATVVHAQVPAANGGGGRRLTSRLVGGAGSSGSHYGNGNGSSSPSLSVSSFASLSGSNSGDNSTFTDEERFYRAKNLASESGIYHRRHHDAPRSFLWRVLEGGYVLSIRAIDVAKHQPESPSSAPDAPLILYLHFPKPVRPGCIALADPQQHDALAVFVLDESFYLHHLLLRPDVFRKRAFANEADLGEAWKPYLSATFNFKQPRCLVAVSANEFVVALHDGGLINFRRDPSHQSPATAAAASVSWKESFHSPVGLIQGLRSILPFQGGPTIKYEGTNLEITAAASAVTATLSLDNGDGTSTGTNGAAFFFTVCLDHRLRIWNIERGEICYTGDILGLAREPHELGKWTIDPSQTNLLRVVPLDNQPGAAIIATYSPVGAGGFKFWKATANAALDGANHGSGAARVEVEPLDSAPDSLLPPTPSAADVWTLADFAISYTAPRKLSLWVLWKNNLIYRVMQTEADLDDLASDWQETWTAVHTESGAPTAQTSGPCDPTDAAEKWLDLIFFPGRFSRATLETALAMYERGLGATKDKTSKRSGAPSSTAVSTTASASSLMESICTVLGSTAALERGSSGAMDYDLFRSASEIQWRRFYRLLIELDKQRSEALALALDPDLGLAWVVCTDCLAAARECSGLELVYHNAPSSQSSSIFGGRGSGSGGLHRSRSGSGSNNANSEKVSRLLSAGASFVDSFSDGMLQTCEAALRAELFDDASSKTDEERIQSLGDKAGFWRHLTEDECAQVIDILGDNFELVDETTYRTLFSLFDDVVQQQLQGGHDVRYPFTQFGLKLVVRGIQDTAELFWQILFRQLILLVHMEFELEDERVALHSRIDVGQVYSRLIDALKRLELVKWLSRTDFSVALKRAERESLSGSFSGGSFSTAAGGSFTAGSAAGSTGGASNAVASDENATQVITVLGGSVGHLLGLGEQAGSVPLSSLLTDIVVDVCSARSTIELDPAMIQCMLLKRGRPDLSLQLSAFATDDPFSTYVQGRTFLALRNYDTAALYFQKAAVGLSTVVRHPLRHSAGLIDDSEWNLFYSGLPNYYAHIVSLYDRQKAYAYVIDFSRLSLQFVRSKANSLSARIINTGSNGSNGSQQAKGGSKADSRHGSFGANDPAAEAAVLSSTRTEMLSRLFTAATALSRFDTAHSALLSMGQPFLPLPSSSSSSSSSPTPSTGTGAAALQRSGLRYLVEKMCETGQVAALLALPFPGGLRDTVDDVLEQKCRAAMEVIRGTPWHHVLYSWRVAHNDYRGAASVLLDQLHKLQQAGEGDKFLATASSAAADAGGSDDILDTPVTRQYLKLINTLSCVDPKQAWIYTEDPLAQASSAGNNASAPHDTAIPSVETSSSDNLAGTQATEAETQSASQASAAASGPASAPASAAAKKSDSNPMASFLQKAAAAQRPPWRKVVTLADLRKQYQAELDRIAAIQNNQFAFGSGGGGGDGEDITMDDS
ncbi:nuclear pore complex protein Nup160 [Sporothrix schenckii 1099-18]|uniref:Nuclear pore complex protein Nup160 n=1 Tax=Sporothrix schenckii 1099-18 TaxID=1397361 RepID=A0A0F2LY02_SPOSC|nr:nuclear pore complex protein Nup160 [Sporothrix schenckii 1099-18]KJR81719.1 nuclear pore complex protein Nup160 [Sporothrix schenckii 1099-18]